MIANVLQNNVLAKQEFSANDGSFNPDGNGNPFFNCLGFKPKAIKKRLEWTAGIWIVVMRKPFVTEKKSKPVQNELENLYMEYLAQHKNCFL